MITAQTTLAELEFEARKRGVTHITCKMESSLGILVGLQVHYGENFVIGSGKTVPEAIAVAFDNLDRETSKRLTIPQPPAR